MKYTSQSKTYTGGITMTNTSIETPYTYSEYQEFLPSFTTMIEKVLIELAPYYKTYVETHGLLNSNDSLSRFLNSEMETIEPSNRSRCYSNELDSIISYELTFAGVNTLNEPFMQKIRSICDEEGYEEGEDDWKAFKQMYDIVVEELEEEVSEYVSWSVEAEILNAVNK